MRGPARHSLIFGLLVSLLTLSALAQVPTGTIRGAVTDPSKAVVPNATVTVRNKGTGAERKVTTNSSGNIRFPRCRRAIMK